MKGGRQKTRDRASLPLNHSAVHLASELFNPCASEAVQMEVKGLTNEVSVRQKQARGQGMAEIQLFLQSPGNNLPITRERAMLCVAYDAMTRRSELITIDVEDIKLLEDGTGRLLIRHSKTDQWGRDTSLTYPARPWGSSRPG